MSDISKEWFKNMIQMQIIISGFKVPIWLEDHNMIYLKVFYKNVALDSYQLIFTKIWLQITAFNSKYYNNLTTKRSTLSSTLVHNGGVGFAWMARESLPQN